MSDDLPVRWSWANFSEVARIAASLVDPTGLSNLPHIAPDNIERDTGRLLPFRTVGEDGMKSAKHRFYPGQLLYSKIRPYLNKCVQVDFAGLCSADVYPLDPLVEPKYLHRYMLTRQFVSAVSKAAGSRTVLPKTNQEQLASVPVPVAPEAEQRRIVSALESYFTRLDDAVATLERVQRNLKRYRASVLKAAVEGRLVPTEAESARAEGRSYEPASVLLTRILAERRRRWEEAERAKMTAKGKAPKDDNWKAKYGEPVAPDTSELPELPEGWCWATFDQLAHDVRYGSSAKSDPNLTSGVPVLRMGNIVDGSLCLADLKYLPLDHSEFPDLLLETGDLLFNRTNSPELVGKTAVFRTQAGPCSFASYLIRVRFLSDIEPDYVALYVNSYAGRTWIGSVVSQQVGQANVNGTKLKACVVPLPPAEEQRRIVRESDRRLSLVSQVAIQLQISQLRLARLRQSILKWAFEGRLVDQDPTDEPASVLLERIRAERASATDIPPRRARRAKARTAKS